MNRPRRRRRNPGWVHEHPWMTFFLISGAVSTLGTIVIAIARPSALGMALDCQDKSDKLPPPGVMGLGAVDFES